MRCVGAGAHLPLLHRFAQGPCRPFLSSPHCSIRGTLNIGPARPVADNDGMLAAVPLPCASPFPSQCALPACSDRSCSGTGDGTLFLALGPWMADVFHPRAPVGRTTTRGSEALFLWAIEVMMTDMRRQHDPAVHPTVPPCSRGWEVSTHSVKLLGGLTCLVARFTRTDLDPVGLFQKLTGPLRGLWWASRLAQLYRIGGAYFGPPPVIGRPA